MMDERPAAIPPAPSAQRRILALDPGHKLGWAVDGRRPGELITGVEILPGQAPDHGVAYCHFQDWLAEMIDIHRVQVLAWEAPVAFGGFKQSWGGRKLVTNQAAVEFLYGLGAVAELVGTVAGLLCWKAVTATVRRHFVGNGRAEKMDVFIRCRALGWPVETLDAADAAAIWDLAAHIYRRADVVAGPLFTAPAKRRGIRRAAPELDP